MTNYKNGDSMWIIGFITEEPVIRSILKHCGRRMVTELIEIRLPSSVEARIPDPSSAGGYSQPPLSGRR